MFRRSLRQIESIPPLSRYALAIIFPILALIISDQVWVLINGTPFVIFLLAVILTAWFGGFLPGAVATFLSAFLAEAFLREPRGILTFTTGGFVQSILFVLASLLISWIEGNRRRNQIALEQARHQLVAVLDTVSDGIVVTSQTGDVLFANQAVPQINGLNADGASKPPDQKPFTLLSEDGTPAAVQDLPPIRVFKESKPSRAVYATQVNPGQDERWIEIKSAPVIDSVGHAEMSVSVFRDITRAKVTERLLSESAARLRQVIDHLGVYVFVTSPDGNLLEANRAALDTLGISHSEVHGKPFASTPWWSHSQDVRDQIQEALEQARNGEEVEFDTSICSKDNEIRAVAFSVAPTYNSEGMLEFLVPSAIDISDRKHKEERLAQLTLMVDGQRQRLNRILNTIPGLIFETTGQSGGPQQVEYMSDYAEKLLGYTTAELSLSENFFRDIILPEDLERVREEAAALIASSQSGILRFRCYRKDGRVIHIEAYIVWIINEAGERTGAVGVLMDITQRREAEEALESYAEELKRSNAELEQFAYIASHDLQEPLRMVTSYLQLIEQRLADRLDGDEREFMNYAIDGGNRMKRLIQALLAYSRVNRDAHEKEPVEVQKVVTEAIQNLKIATEDSGANIQVGQMPEVLGNENQLIQLFQNLIGNAIKFANEKPPEIIIEAEETGNFWQFSVKDNGIGIEPQYLDRIFVIFQRLHARDEYEGTGIGLAVCKKIVENHGGRIWATSVPGEGATFFFTLPRKAYRRTLHGSHRNLVGRGQSG